MRRREFLAGGLAAAAVAGRSAWGSPRETPLVDAAAVDRGRVLKAAELYLREEPRTITSVSSPRSTGGAHDYFSEGDYWWPDEKNPDGPYVRRDGYSNPANFNAHRELLIRLSVQMPALTAAWVLTKNSVYAKHAAAHLRAWFVDEDTLMHPNLEHAQAIQGVTPGRGVGIIDTLHLVEVARAAMWLEHAGVMDAATQTAVREWFRQYTRWMMTSKNGQEERDAKNNHGTCWVAQVAAFAAYVGDIGWMEFCRTRYREHLIPEQVGADGRLPLELARTKPYSYSLFNMDVLATCCQVLSEGQRGEGDLWRFKTAQGQGIASVVAFMAPYIRDKAAWPFAKDVEYFDDLPVRQPSLLFAGLAYRDRAYVELWRRLNPDPVVAEIIRNFPVRQPVLWVSRVG
ncbi:Alginate lyase [Bryocella elongata]|uniref:Alginate lyase n=1 Tax=Bryocella elongata TaxID=863522 RepID=A0A1H6C435_9BACT|nr:alginate lyase family protein [Bryocella elongata]SEG67126.1 Alginate lyase [Bryocella elongata]